MQAVGEAPGRLDFQGGIADYSGALVLQTPIRATTRVTISTLDEPIIRLESTSHACVDWLLRNLRDLQNNLKTAPQWARYVLGCLHLFCDAQSWQPASGLRFYIP